MYQRLTKALSPAAMILAIFALVVAAAGAGYSAATIGTSDLKKNAVTSAKVKNGTLKAADMVKEKKFTNVTNFRSGGQGDCVWSSAHTIIPQFARPGFRMDRWGTVHLVGVAVGQDGLGGDGICDVATEQEDGIVTVLPAKFRPAKVQVRLIGAEGSIVVAGRQGLPALGLPAGAIFWSGSPSFGALLDGISFLPAGSPVVGREVPGKTQPGARALLKQYGLG